MDDLEQEFTENNKASFTAETMDKLFPDSVEISAKAFTGFSKLDETIRPLAQSMLELKVPSPENSLQSMAGALEDEKTALLSSLVAELRDGVELLQSKLQVRLAGAAVDLKRKYVDEIKRARRSRVVRLSSLAVGAGLLAALICFGYFYLTQPIEHNVFNALIWEVIAGIIVSVITFVVAGAFDSFPKTSARLRREYQALLRSEFERITGEELKSHQFSALEHGSLTERLKRTYWRIVECDPDGWNQIAADRVSSLRRFDSECRALQARYIAETEQLVDGISAYFSDATKNLEALNGVADGIKARAIQPSFELLDQTRQSLENVKNEIFRIEFA